MTFGDEVGSRALQDAVAHLLSCASLAEKENNLLLLFPRQI